MPGYLDKIDVALRLNNGAEEFRTPRTAGRGSARTLIAGRRYYRIAALDTWLLDREQPSRRYAWHKRRQGR